MLRVVQFETAWESQALLHFAGRPFAVKQSRYPLLPSVGWLPLLLDGQRVVRGEAVVAHVCDVNGDGTFLMPQRAADGQGSASDDGGLGDGRPRAAAEGALSADAAAASTALLSMVRYELDVLWRRWRWTHRRARTEAVVWSQLSPQWMHPARWVALRLIARAEVGRVESNQLECGAATEAAVVRRIVRCYAALTAHLARVRAETGGDFFGGARPGALDAAVFGHLAAVEADAECVRALDARARRKIEEDVAVQRRRRAAAAAKAAKKAAALAAAAEGDDVESAAARGAVRRAAASLLLEKELDAIVAESFGALKAHYEGIRQRWFADVGVGGRSGGGGGRGGGGSGGSGKGSMGGVAPRPAERWSAYGAAPAKSTSDSKEDAAAAAPRDAELVSARQWFAFTASASALFIILYHTPVLSWVKGGGGEAEQ